MDTQGLEQIEARFKVYKSKQRISQTITLLLLLLILLEVVLWYAISSYDAEARYLPVKPTGQVIKDIPSNQAHLKDEQVIEFAKDALLDIFSFDYATYKYQLQVSRPYFTAKGYDTFLNALKESSNIDTIKRRRQVVWSKINGKSKIVKKGMKSEAVAWKVEVPMVVNYEEFTGKSIQQNITFLVTVERVSTLENELGIAISQLVNKV